MEKQTTAMQQLLEFNDTLCKTEGHKLTAYDVYKRVIEKANELLPLERQQIEDAIIKCRKLPYIKKGEVKFDLTAEQYFNQTFK